MIYEGYFSKGERHGKGKKYYVNDQFEGEFLNGEKWSGKGYKSDGNLEYELKNGCGKIKEYDYNGRLIFEGEYFNGKRHGKGKEYYCSLRSLVPHFLTAPSFNFFQ